ncbi:SLAP domain-containing protein [Lapidilactobacillus achengensis]|uniref:SLAP domain-containing protein n=1 Tax=Lapidilactobacillus achengensis TaxID=2486000 RepID=A0ABW1US37_9LACO|nr:SLAP domain-containing protein [Lapidilactobacillus achengensis]
MKKNSKLRYVGLCAAALLLVAPVAAPALSAASNVSVVSAAVSDDDALKSLTEYLNGFSQNADTLSTDNEDSIIAAAKELPEKFDADKFASNPILSRFAKSSWTFTDGANLAGYNFTLKAVKSGLTSDEAIRDLFTNKKGSLTFVLQATKTNLNTNAEDNVKAATLTLNYAKSADVVGVKGADATFTSPLKSTVGATASSFKTFEGVLADLKVTTDQGASVSLAGMIHGKPVVANNSASDVVYDSDSNKFVKNGSAKQTYKIVVPATSLTKKVDGKDFALSNISVNGVKLRAAGDVYAAFGDGFSVVSEGTVPAITSGENGAVVTGDLTLSVSRTINVGDAEEVPTEVKVSGVVQINYVPGYGIQVWDSYKDGKIVRDANGKAKKLAHGTAWKVFKKITIKGTTYYNLGGNQWVSDDYAKFSAK